MAACSPMQTNPYMLPVLCAAWIECGFLKHAYTQSLLDLSSLVMVYCQISKVVFLADRCFLISRLELICPV